MPACAPAPKTQYHETPNAPAPAARGNSENAAFGGIDGVKAVFGKGFADAGGQAANRAGASTRFVELPWPRLA